MFNELRKFERVITPNRRLASFLSKQLVAALPADEFYTGKILAWQDFLRDRWEECRYKVLLSSWQSHTYWQQAIAQNDNDLPLLDTAETVHLAKQAHGLLQQWQYDTNSLHGIKPDTDLFLQWQADYLKILEDKGAIDETSLAFAVGDALYASRASEVFGDTTILLYGFDSFTPEQQHLFEKLKQSGHEIIIADLSSLAKIIVRNTYQNIKQEITSIAQQVKTAFERNPNPDLPLGVVVPQLSEHWRLVNDTFGDLPFNISAGLPLADIPVIKAAHTLFDMLKAKPSIDTWSQLCNTPFIASGMTEMPARAQFEFKLRQSQAQQLSWEWVLARKNIPEQLKTCLQGAFKLLQHKPKAAKPSVWQAWLLQWLQQWGWPGERNLNSDEYQAVTHFYRLLNELAGLDFVVGETMSSNILSQLRTQARQRMFQSESEDKPIQVLGMLEAAGMQFNQLWITGLSHDVWPQKPSPNPFIPTHVQIEQNMPHANAEREFTYAQTMLNRLLTASETVNLSFARFELNSDSERLPSPLIQDFPEKTIEIEQSETLAQTLQKTKKISPLPETQGMEFASAALKGGAGIFKDQAACPFRAYAKYRLQAVAPELPVLGLSPKIKGIVLHAALETLWQQLKTQENLAGLSETELNGLCEQHLRQALGSVSPKLSAQQQALEQRRATPLLLAWLQLEKARERFGIQGLEVATQAQLSGIPLSLRLDRMDTLPDGSFLLIDYKTGDIKAKDWLGLRPDEPQLPLYASLMDSPPSGIAFAVLRKKKVELISMNRENSDWETQLTDWRNAVENLALEFRAGRADIAPKYGVQTCQQCDLQLLCRVGEL